MNEDKLVELRTRIDDLDKELLQILGRRMATVREIGLYKKAHSLAPLDQQRWQMVMNERLSIAEALGLSDEFVGKLYQLIHEYALEIERKAAS